MHLYEPGVVAAGDVSRLKTKTNGYLWVVFNEQSNPVSVATVMTNVFHTNKINLLRKFAKIVRVFDEVDESKNRGFI